ncbi:MAG: hypothetical protein AAB403_03165 [Planctomycetota bacterium]
MCAAKMCFLIVFEEPFRDNGEAFNPMELRRIPPWHCHQIGNRLG